MTKNKNNIDLQYLLYFNFLKIDDYKKLKKILSNNFFNDTPFGKLPDENKTKLLKKIYLKLKK